MYTSIELGLAGRLGDRRLGTMAAQPQRLVVADTNFQIERLVMTFSLC